jgi:hypothetical protein
MEETLSGARPVEESYPYFDLDYRVPFIHIGTEKQLFVDNFILDHLDGVERVFPEPYRPERPILEVGDLPWESVANPIPSGAVWDPDERKFKLWYAQSLTGDPFNTGQVLCYAESTDALHWTKPLSERCLPFEGHKATNIVARDTAAIGIVLNHDRSDPSQKFLMVYCPYGEATAQGKNIISRFLASPDGIVWTTVSEDTPYRHQHEQRILWDASIRKWVGYSQYSHHWQRTGPRVRQIGRQESDDFIRWSPKEPVMSGEWDPSLAPGMEFGTAAVYKVGGQYLMVAAEYPCEPLWCVREYDGANWRDQVRPRLGLYCSRDGKRWYRAGRSPWVANRGPGSIDYGYLDGVAPNYLVHDGRMIIPYLAAPHKQWVTGRSDNPTLVPAEARDESAAELELLRSVGTDPNRLGRSVGALVLREDGWAALRPTRESGRVYTRQFVFEGDTLRVNAACEYGAVRVEALDPYFNPYPGFAAADCAPLHGAGVWHDVRWQGGSSVRALWDKPVRLRFELKQASLFAFQFE